MNAIDFSTYGYPAVFDDEAEVGSATCSKKVTPEMVSAAYQQYLRRNGINPKSLTSDQLLAEYLRGFYEIPVIGAKYTECVRTAMKRKRLSVPEVIGLLELEDPEDVLSGEYMMALERGVKSSGMYDGPIMQRAYVLADEYRCDVMHVLQQATTEFLEAYSAECVELMAFAEIETLEFPSGETVELIVNPTALTRVSEIMVAQAKKDKALRDRRHGNEIQAGLS